MNKVLLVGRLTFEPDIRETSNGVMYARCSIAVTRSYSREITDFIPIVAWRHSAQFIKNYVRKGNLVSIEGIFISSRYVNSENKNVTKYEVQVDRINLLQPKSNNDNANTKDIVEIPGLDNLKFEADAELPRNDVKSEKTNNEDETPKTSLPWDIEF